MPPADHYHQDIAALRDRLTRLSRASLSIKESLGSVRSLTGVSVPSSSRVGCHVNDGLEMSHFYGLKLNHLVFAQRFGQCA